MRSPSDPSSGDRTGPLRPAKVREDRLKAALKANMARRKAQAKARTGDKSADGKTDETNEG
jgi:hypothetical protein